MHEHDKYTALLKLIATNIVHLRKEKKYTQDELADRAGIDRTYIGYIENAKQNVTISKLADIASALNVTVDKLFELNPHAIGRLSDIEQMNVIFPFVTQYQELAKKYDINDIFQDNGGKLLQVLLVTGLSNIRSREGNDAIDNQGNEYELKSVNHLLTSLFSTHHHLNPTIIGKYRLVNWIFAVYEGIELKEIYFMEVSKLEPLFVFWEQKWHLNKRDLNNPKIPLKFVRENGNLIFSMPNDKQLSAINLKDAL
jgi:transcriptional regulator with XRE-family HTH domain